MENNNYPYYWGGGEVIPQPENIAQEEEPKTKYEIVYDEMSCTSWGFVVNGVWRGAERDDKVTYPEDDEQLVDYVLATIKEHLKKGYTDFKSVMDCIQSDDTEWSEDSCDTCGHSGHRTIWRI